MCIALVVFYDLLALLTHSGDSTPCEVHVHIDT